MLTVHYGHTGSIATFISARYSPRIILGLENIPDVDFDNNVDDNGNVIDKSWGDYTEMV